MTKATDASFELTTLVVCEVVGTAVVTDVPFVGRCVETELVEDSLDSTDVVVADKVAVVVEGFVEEVSAELINSTELVSCVLGISEEEEEANMLEDSREEANELVISEEAKELVTTWEEVAIMLVEETAEVATEDPDETTASASKVQLQ